MAHESVAFEQPKKSFWERPSRSLKLPLRFARPAEGKSPDSAGNARMAVVAMLISFAIIAVFNSEGAQHFTRDLPGNAFTDRLVEAAEGWHGLMEQLGPARIEPALRERFDRLRGVSW